MAKPFDTTLNSLIDAHADEWAAFAAARCGVPFGPVTSVDTDLSANLQADRLFRIDGPSPAMLHLELESSGRLGIPTELLRYNVAAHAVNGLPVYSLLILLRPKATATDLTGQLDIGLADGRPYLTFRYSVLRVWQEPMERLLTSGVGLVPLAILTNEAEANLPAAVERFQRRLQEADVTDSVREKLVSLTYTLGGLRYPEKQLLELFMKLDQILEDSTTVQGLIRRGARSTLVAVARKRFGPSPDAETALSGITDLPRLERMTERVLDATGWDDLLATE